jgi:cytochrome c oxidase subunit II
MYSTTGLDASNFVSTFNTSYYFITGISLLLLAGLTIVMLYFVFRYNKKKNKTAIQNEGNIKLEIIWTVIPLLLSIAMFYVGWEGWKPMTKAPKDAINVTSTARMWSFSFQYENGKQSPDLVIPVNVPVKIKLISLDVLHSLYIPAFRVKSDMVPGTEKMMWFLPQTIGEYDLYCAEYCGLRHSYMNANVKVLSMEDYTAWYANSSTVMDTTEASKPGSEGLEIMINQGCIACHSSDGSKIVGPSFLDLLGKTQNVVIDGKDVTITVDEDYIKKSIYDPNAEIVKGYPGQLMQSYKDALSEDDIAKIIEYLNYLNDN